MPAALAFGPDRTRALNAAELVVHLQNARTVLGRLERTPDGWTSYGRELLGDVDEALERAIAYGNELVNALGPPGLVAVGGPGQVGADNGPASLSGEPGTPERHGDHDSVAVAVGALTEVRDQLREIADRLEAEHERYQRGRPA